eukprot:tig00020561_g11103.t1
MGFRASKNTDESGPAPAPGPGAEGRTPSPEAAGRGARPGPRRRRLELGAVEGPRRGVAPDPETVVEPAACSWRLRDRRRRAPRRAPGARRAAANACRGTSKGAPVGPRAKRARREAPEEAAAEEPLWPPPAGVEPLLRAVAGLQLRAGGVAAAADVSAERLAAKLASSERVLRAVRAELTRFSAAGGGGGRRLGRLGRPRRRRLHVVRPARPLARPPAGALGDAVRRLELGRGRRANGSDPAWARRGEAHKAELRVASSSKPANGKPAETGHNSHNRWAPRRRRPGRPPCKRRTCPVQAAETCPDALRAQARRRFRSKEDAHLLVERCAEESLRAVAADPWDRDGDGALDGGEPEALPGQLRALLPAPAGGGGGAGARDKEKEKAAGEALAALLRRPLLRRFQGAPRAREDQWPRPAPEPSLPVRRYYPSPPLPQPNVYPAGGRAGAGPALGGARGGGAVRPLRAPAAKASWPLLARYQATPEREWPGGVPGTLPGAQLPKLEADHLRTIRAQGLTRHEKFRVFGGLSADDLAAERLYSVTSAMWNHFNLNEATLEEWDARIRPIVERKLKTAEKKKEKQPENRAGDPGNQEEAEVADSDVDELTKGLNSLPPVPRKSASAGPEASAAMKALMHGKAGNPAAPAPSPNAQAKALATLRTKSTPAVTSSSYRAEFYIDDVEAMTKKHMTDAEASTWLYELCQARAIGFLADSAKTSTFAHHRTVQIALKSKDDQLKLFGVPRCDPSFVVRVYPPS